MINVCTFLPLAIQFFAPTGGVILGLVILVLLVIGSGFVSGSEASFFSLHSIGLEILEEQKEKHPRYKLALKMLQAEERLLATILIANNLINIGIVILSAYITDSLVSFQDAELEGFLIKVVLITLLLLLFGEVLPKQLGASRPLRYVHFAARPLYCFYVVLSPFARLMAYSARRMNERFAPHLDLSMDQIEEALEITKEENGNSDEESLLIKRLAHYGKIDVCEIMHPRVDVFALDFETPYTEVKKQVIATGYSRIPVYKESFDTIVGVLYVKDLLPYIDENDSFVWTSLLRPAYFVPENKKIDELLTEFQTQRIHLAIVVDEYGGTCGVVTLEDILEEVLGEIADESDGVEKMYTQLDARTYRFDAKILLNDFCKIIGRPDTDFDEIRGEAETLAGLVLEKLERFPEQGELVYIEDLKLTIEAVTNRRIEQIRVELPDTAPREKVS